MSETTSMTAEIKDKTLIITLPIRTPAPSKSGKTLVVATSSGIQATTVIVDGKVLKVGVNAFISKD